MSWDRIEGNWKQYNGKAKEQRGRPTDDHLDVISGERHRLVGKMQECYGVGKDEARKQINAWELRIPHYLNDGASRQ